MKILVTAKRVTDFNARIRLRRDGSGIDLDGVEYQVNPFDENAVEEALKIREERGGEVVVVSIGPAEVETYIRTAMAMGADRGVRIELDDEALDSDLVARLLAAVAKREEAELVIIGKQSIDGDNNQVGQLLSAYLGWPQACFASVLRVDEAGQSAEVTREVDGGLETIEVQLPAVITSDLRLNEPRYASLPGIMKAKRKPIDLLDVAELGVDTTLKVRTVGLEAPPSRQAGVQVESVEDLVHRLQNEAKIL